MAELGGLGGNQLRAYFLMTCEVRFMYQYRWTADFGTRLHHNEAMLPYPIGNISKSRVRLSRGVGSTGNKVSMLGFPFQNKRLRSDDIIYVWENLFFFILERNYQRSQLVYSS